MLMLGAGITAHAQINEGLHWYNGQITFTARNIENKGVVMEAMDEGEEHELILRYVEQLNVELIQQMEAKESGNAKNRPQ